MANFNDILTAWTLDREKVLIQNYESKNIKASGNFANKIIHEITNTSTTISAPMYIGGTILGRKPNANNTPEQIKKWVGWAGSTIIKQWCIDKGIETGAAYAIAYKIAREGWKIPNAHGNDGRLLKDTFTPESIDQLKKDIGGFYTLQIKSDIQNAWQQV